MTVDRRWAAALADHEREVTRFLAVVARVDPAEWHRPRAPGKWSPAAEVLHVCRAYELAHHATDGGPGMRLLVSPRKALLLRRSMLPLILATKRFPHGVPAPREVVPDMDESAEIAPAASIQRFTSATDAAALALHDIDTAQPAFRVTHAYFGPLAPRTVLRLLSAHTRHHARALSERYRT